MFHTKSDIANYKTAIENFQAEMSAEQSAQQAALNEVGLGGFGGIWNVLGEDLADFCCFVFFVKRFLRFFEFCDFWLIFRIMNFSQKTIFNLAKLTIQFL